MTQEEMKEFEKQIEEVMPHCEELINDAVDFLQQEPAIMSYLGLTEFRIVKDPDVTMRLNCKGTGSMVYLEYNPLWMNKIEEASILSFCIFGECLRIALHHITTRKSYPLNIFKMASDFIVFEEQNRQVLNIHKDVVKKAAEQFPTRSQFREIAKDYEYNEENDWYLEKLFAILEDILSKNQEQNQQQNSSSSQEGESNDSNDGNGKSKSGKKKQNSGYGESSKEALKEYLNPNEQASEKATEGWEENNMVDQAIAEKTHEIAKKGASAWGNISGGLLQSILAKNTPKADWKAMLRMFKTHCVSNTCEETRMRPNRRRGFDAYGLRHKFHSRILIAIDCSGSMPDSDVEKACSLIYPFIKFADVSYCFWDGVCGPFEKIKKKQSQYNLVGRGCTNPNCVLEAIKERKAKFEGILMITDNGFTWKRPDTYANKIVLISTADADEPPEWVNYNFSFKQMFED